MSHRLSDRREMPLNAAHHLLCCRLIRELGERGIGRFLEVVDLPLGGTNFEDLGKPIAAAGIER